MLEMLWLNLMNKSVLSLSIHTDNFKNKSCNSSCDHVPLVV